MRNIAIAALTLVAACGYGSYDAFESAFEAESTRIVEDLCEIETTDDEGEGDEVEVDCDEFDADAAKTCIDGMKAIDECPDFTTAWIPSACGDVCTAASVDTDEDSDA